MKNKPSSKFYNGISAPYALWCVLFIVAPLIIVLYYALTNSDGNFTLDNIKHLSMYGDTIARSIYFGLIATVICLFISYPLAYFISKTKASTQSVLIMMVMVPMWMNFLLRTYAIMVLFEDTGIINNILNALGISPVHLINTSGAVIFGMVYNYLPFMILPLYTAMTKLDYRLIEAARDLGANGFQTVKDVMIPLTKSGIISGITMVFVPSVSTFYISQKLGGGKYTLIGDIIEMQFQTAYNYNLGASISMLLMILILICLAVMNKFGEDQTEGGVVV
ncbi:MAG: ABC transporter permease [Oscillospiraceae bacterium]|nr:ABC transporter permease [Oscillospiraceae bacterium]